MDGLLAPREQRAYLLLAYLLLAKVLPKKVASQIAHFLNPRCTLCDEGLGVLTRIDNAFFEWRCITCTLSFMEDYTHRSIHRSVTLHTLPDETSDEGLDDTFSAPGLDETEASLSESDPTESLGTEPGSQPSLAQRWDTDDSLVRKRRRLNGDASFENSYGRDSATE